MARPSSLPFAWKPLAGRALERAFERMLALDPDTRDALRALDGRHVDVRLDVPALALRLSVDGAHLRVGPADAAVPTDLAVRGSLGGFLAQLPFLQREGATATGRVHLDGDADLARRLQSLARGYDPDWQQPFADLFGEVLGVQIAQAVAGGLQRARGIGRSVAESAAEYLTEESRDVVGRHELDAFLDDVDAVRDGVDRLQARVTRLQRRRAGGEATA